MNVTDIALVEELLRTGAHSHTEHMLVDYYTDKLADKDAEILGLESAVASNEDELNELAEEGQAIKDALQEAKDAMADLQDELNELKGEST